MGVQDKEHGDVYTEKSGITGLKCRRFRTQWEAGLEPAKKLIWQALKVSSLDSACRTDSKESKRHGRHISGHK